MIRRFSISLVAVAVLSTQGVSKPLNFNVGDVWVFSLNILGVEVGVAAMRIDGIVEKNGRKLIKADAFVKSNEFLERFYTLNDRLTVLINPETLRAVEMKKWIKEGDYEDYLVVKFDYKKLEGFVKGVRKFSKGVKFKLTPRTRDFLSAILYYQMIDYVEGRKYTFEYELAPKIKKTIFRGYWNEEGQKFKGKDYRQFVFEQVGELNAKFRFLVDKNNPEIKLPYAMYVPAYKVPIFGVITIDVYLTDFRRGNQPLKFDFKEPDYEKEELVAKKLREKEKNKDRKDEFSDRDKGGK